MGKLKRVRMCSQHRSKRRGLRKSLILKCRPLRHPPHFYPNPDEGDAERRLWLILHYLYDDPEPGFEDGYKSTTLTSQLAMRRAEVEIF
jgi:hypothetical protein